MEATYPVAWSFLSFDVMHGESVPQHPNGFDYGVYVIKFIDTSGIITNESYVVRFFNLFMWYTSLLLLMLLDH